MSTLSDSRRRNLSRSRTAKPRYNYDAAPEPLYTDNGTVITFNQVGGVEIKRARKEKVVKDRSLYADKGLGLFSTTNFQEGEVVAVYAGFSQKLKQGEEKIVGQFETYQIKCGRVINRPWDEAVNDYKNLSPKLYGHFANHTSTKKDENVQFCHFSLNELKGYQKIKDVLDELIKRNKGGWDFPVVLLVATRKIDQGEMLEVNYRNDVPFR